MGNAKKIGTAGEELAAEILKGKGYYIITRNFSCPYGEVDIIAVRDRIISFIEVKTRTTEEYGRPAEAVDILGPVAQLQVLKILQAGAGKFLG